MFFYSDTDKFSGKVNLASLDPVIMYMKHYENFLFLSFMSENGTVLERKQALIEINIAKRKMKFWSKSPKFDSQRMLDLRTTANKKWNKDK